MVAVVITRMQLDATGVRRRGSATRRRRAAGSRSRWFWRAARAPRRRGWLAWTGGPSGQTHAFDGCTATTPRGLRACATASA